MESVVGNIVRIKHFNGNQLYTRVEKEDMIYHLTSPPSKEETKSLCYLKKGFWFVFYWGGGLDY